MSLPTFRRNLPSPSSDYKSKPRLGKCGMAIGRGWGARSGASANQKGQEEVKRILILSRAIFGGQSNLGGGGDG